MRASDSGATIRSGRCSFGIPVEDADEGAPLKRSERRQPLEPTLQQSIGDLGLTPWHLRLLGRVRECEPTGRRAPTIGALPGRSGEPLHTDEKVQGIIGETRGYDAAEGGRGVRFSW